MKILINEGQYETIIHIIKEDVSMAEKILRLNNIDKSDSVYTTIKNELVKNSMVGYLGPIIKMSINVSGKLTVGTTNRIYQFITDNKKLIKSLPKPFIKYDDFSDLMSDIDVIMLRGEVKKLHDKLTSKFLKENLKKVYDKVDLLNDETHSLVKSFNKLSGDKQKEFLRKTDKFNNFSNFIKSLEKYIYDIVNGYYGMLEKIKNIGEKHLSIKYTNDKMGHILVRVIDYQGARDIGSTSWCIVGDERTFNNYVKEGYVQYFFFNFSDDVEDNLKMLAFTMNESSDNDPVGYITASHDRFDRVFNDPVGYLVKIGVHKKILVINSREKAKYRLVRNFNKEYYEDYYAKNEYINIYTYKIVESVINLINSKNFDGTNLDLLVNKLENFESWKEVLDDERNKRNNANYFTKVIETRINVFILLTDFFIDREKTNTTIRNLFRVRQMFDEGINETLSEKNEKRLIDFYKKVYNSGIKLSQESRFDIMRFLKSRGVDILDMSYNKSMKYGNDLSDTVVNLLSKSGKNLKPIIQNKLSSIRRGKDVSMNVSEVMYAIENGYKDIIMKYYLSIVKDYMYNPLDYDDMRIYQKLGILDKVRSIIYQKGKTFGIDTLNSIEMSIYDFEKRKTV
jgi:hypothetical protein